MSQNVGFYAGGLKFETWKDWSYQTTLHWLPPAADNYTTHPTLDEDIKRGAAFIDLDDLAFKVFDGTDYVPLSGSFDSSFDYNITGSWTFENGLTIANGVEIFGRNNADDASIPLLSVTPANAINLGSPNNQLNVRSSATAQHTVAGVPCFEVVPRSSGGALVYDRQGSPRKLGFRNNPIVFASTPDFVLVQDYEGSIVTVTTSSMVASQLEQSSRMEIYNADQVCVVDGVANGVTFIGYTAAGTRPTGGTLTLTGGAKVDFFWRTTDQVYVSGNGFVVS